MPRLTDLTIRNSKPAQELLLPDGGNLYLRIRPKPTAEKGFSYSWLVRIKRHGKRRVHSLGNYPGLTIKDARAEAANLVAKERGDARVDVQEAVEDYMGVMIRPRYRRANNAEVYARHLQVHLGKIAVDAVRPVEVSRMIAAYVRTAPVAAMRMLGFTKQFFNWCVAFGYLDRSPIADVQSSAFGVVEQDRERILTDDEIKTLWNTDDLPHRALLRFLLLTGLRIGEAQAARREWIDDDGWLALPASVMKAGKPHLCYLSKLAREQLEAAAAPSLFRVVSPTAVQAAVHRWSDRHYPEPRYTPEGVLISRWTPHDLRRSFASRCGDLGIAPHVIAKLLAHTFAPSASLPVYLRSEWIDERKQATEALAAHIAEVVK